MGKPVDPRAVALFAAALVLCGPARAQVAAEGLLDMPGAEDLEVRAEHLTWDRAGRRARLLGDVHLKMGEALLLAPEVRFDLDARRVEAEGGVTLLQGARTLQAERLSFELDAPVAEAEEALVELRRGGRVRLRLAARRLLRVDADRWRGTGLFFTSCDCGPGARPAWSITAASGTVTPGEGALLWWPVLRILDVPVLPLPALYVPLAQRRTGLLLPQVGWSGRNGLRLAEPLFVTLGPSFDLTLTPGWYGGVDEAGVRGVRGFDQALEVRWAPWAGTGGRLILRHLYDTTEELGAARGSRLSLELDHRSRFDGGGFGVAGHGLALDAFLVDDAALVSDLALRLERREVGYLRSTGRLFVSPSPHVQVEAGALWLQDLRLRVVGGRTRPLFGEGAPFTFQRLPELHAATSPLALPGGFSTRLAFHGLHWAASGGAFEDAGTDRLLRGDLGWCDEARADCLSSGEGDGVLGPGEQGPVLHGRLEADLGRGLHLGEFVAGRATVGLRADGWLHAGVAGAPERSALRLYPILDASFHTALERRFQDLTHRLEPRLRWRLVPGVLQRGLPADLDAFDRAVPEGGLHQASAELTSVLSRGGRRLFDLRLAQGLDLRRGALDEVALFARLVHPREGHQVLGRAAFDWRSGRTTLALGNLRVRLPGGGSAGALVHYVAPEASDWLRAGLDELFAAGALLPSPFLGTARGDVPVSAVVVNLRTPALHGLTAFGSLRLDASGRLDALAPQPVVGLDYRSPCGCWAASVLAVWPPGQDLPELAFGLELSDLGGISTRTN